MEATAGDATPSPSEGLADHLLVHRKSQSDSNYHPGKGNRPRLDQTTLPSPERRHGVHPAAICLKWAEQRGQVAIPFSVKERQYKSNMDAIIKDPLTEDEMKEIGKINKNNRLIKGQVFLWKDNQSWEDLWDLDGHIAE